MYWKFSVVDRLARGDPACCLPIVSYALVSHSPYLAEHLMGFSVELTGASDLRFLESLYKVSQLCVYKRKLRGEFLFFLCLQTCFIHFENISLVSLVWKKTRDSFRTSLIELWCDMINLSAIYCLAPSNIFACISLCRFFIKHLFVLHSFYFLSPCFSSSSSIPPRPPPFYVGKHVLHHVWFSLWAPQGLGFPRLFAIDASCGPMCCLK